MPRRRRDWAARCSPPLRCAATTTCALGVDGRRDRLAGGADSGTPHCTNPSTIPPWAQPAVADAPLKDGSLQPGGGPVAHHEKSLHHVGQVFAERTGWEASELAPPPAADGGCQTTRGYCAGDTPPCTQPTLLRSGSPRRRQWGDTSPTRSSRPGQCDRRADVAPGSVAR
jgi:hypothetical protein